VHEARRIGTIDAAEAVGTEASDPLSLNEEAGELPAERAHVRNEEQ
jgi:hypothetical protein